MRGGGRRRKRKGPGSTSNTQCIAHEGSVRFGKVAAVEEKSILLY